MSVAPSPSDWRDEAACLDMDREIFFPIGEEGRQTLPAKVICAGCPVREFCLDWALLNGAEFGIWGGLTSRERRDYLIRRRHNRGHSILGKAAFHQRKG
jgi:WhiB family redox-sensing transcriptional regulator